MAGEIVDICSESMEITGTASRKDAHRKGLLHRTFQCWFSDSQNLYFQIRGHNVEFPDFLDATVGGHISAGESVEDASREIMEEIGIEVRFKDLFYLGRHYFAYSDSVHRVREMDEVYIAGIEGGLESFRPSRNELAGIAAIPLSAGDTVFNGSGTGISVETISVDVHSRKSGQIMISAGSFIPGTEKYFSHMFEVARKFSSGSRNIRFEGVLTE